MIKPPTLWYFVSKPSRPKNLHSRFFQKIIWGVFKKFMVNPRYKKMRLWTLKMFLLRCLSFNFISLQRANPKTKYNMSHSPKLYLEEQIRGKNSRKCYFMNQFLFYIYIFLYKFRFLERKVYLNVQSVSWMSALGQSKARSQ